MQHERIYSASELDRIAGIQPIERRRMVKQGLLKPRRTAGGWALFVWDDVAKAREWKQERRKRGGRGKR